MGTLLQDLRYGVRILRRNPGFTAVAVLTLALGIGANTAMFSVVYGVLIRPLPFKDPERLYTLWERNLKKGYDQNPPAAGNFLDWRAQNNVFEQTAAFDGFRTFNLAGDDRPDRVDGAAVSPNIFSLLGVDPIMGRTFSAEEEQPGRDRVVILSHGLWQRRFSADPSIVGKTATINGRSCTIIGVMPPGFQFPGETGTILDIYTVPRSQLWVPLALTPSVWGERSNHYLEVIARLGPGITLAQAQAEMNSIEQRLVKAYPREFIGSDVKFVPLHAQVVANFRLALMTLFGAVAFVLLIGCSNVANLLMARASSRQREVAVRSALGASRVRLIRQLLTESLVLAFAGGILGVLLASWGISLFRLIVPENFPRVDHIQLDRWVLGFSVLISLTTGLIFGLAPAVEVSAIELTESLKEGSRGADGLRGSRLRSLLVVSEVALALVLLIGTGLMIQSLVRLLEVKSGFSPDHLLTMEISLPEAKYPQNRQKAAFFEQLLDRVRMLPGVQSTGATTQLPLAGNNENYAVRVEGRPELPVEYTSADCHAVTLGYFQTMKIPLVEGRYFDGRDSPESTHVVIISETLAHHVFPNESPIGKQLRLGFRNFGARIVGVVGDVKHLTLDSAPRQEVYACYSQAPFWETVTLTVRTAFDPLSLAGTVRGEVLAIDKDQPVSKVRTMNQVVRSSISAPRFRTLILVLFGSLAMFLAAIGIYGVTSYSVSQRSREIGIRMALGATRTEVLKLVLGKGMALTLVGIVVGFVGAFGLTRFLSGMLYGIRPADPLTFVGVALLLAAVGLVAAYVPARRATKVDPMVALRYE